MMKKSRDHQILVIIMAHIDSNLVRQIYSTLSSNAYNDVLQQIDFLKDLLLKEISTHKETYQEGTAHYTLYRVIIPPRGCTFQ